MRACHHITKRAALQVSSAFSFASAAFLEDDIMPTVKLHYEGWVSLPSGLRRKLGLNSGDRLEADLVNGTIVLRPATKASHPGPRDEQASDHPAADVPETLTPKASPSQTQARAAAKKRSCRRARRPYAEAPAWPAEGGSCAAARTCARACCDQQRALEAAAQGGPAAQGGERGGCPAAGPPALSGQKRSGLAGGRAPSISQRRGAQARAGPPA